MPSVAPTRLHEICRICGSRDLHVYLDLGAMPLVNRYLDSPNDRASEPRFPLQVAYCGTCWLSQLTCVVDPRLLYSEYAYHSSISQTFRLHCHDLATSLAQRYKLDRHSPVVEIASNDGCLQKAFQEQGICVLGIEPASNLAATARNAGFQVLNHFWNHDSAEATLGLQGPASLIVATNVVAHVDNLHEFLSAIRTALSPDGVFVFEVPYLQTFLTKTEFDTTYHEHLSYFLLTPLKMALERAGLHLVHVEELTIHGGSIRVHAHSSPTAEPTNDVARMLQIERDCGFLHSELYDRFWQHVQTVRDELSLFLHALRDRGRKIAAYGASAKGNVLLNFCDFGPDLISCIVDDTPAKQGKFSPGNGIPIVSREYLSANHPDYILLLAWNFSEELIANLPEFKKRGGRFIIPIPALRVI